MVNLNKPKISRQLKTKVKEYEEPWHVSKYVRLAIFILIWVIIGVIAYFLIPRWSSQNMCVAPERMREGIIAQEQADGSIVTKRVKMTESEYRKLRAFMEE